MPVIYVTMTRFIALLLSLLLVTAGIDTAAFGGERAAAPWRPQLAQKKHPRGSKAVRPFRRAPPDHDKARDSMKRGLIKSFGDIRRIVQRRFGGKVIDADLDRSGTPFIYNVRVLTDKGTVVAVRVNAQNGRILGSRGRR